MTLTLPFKDQWDQGPNADERSGFGNCGTGENNVPATVGANVSWLNPSNITSQFSLANSTVDADQNNDIVPYIRASNFGWDTIPTGSTILGIEAEIVFSNNENSVWDELEVRLAWGASAANLSANDATGNMASGTTIVLGTNTYGGATDVWGTSLALSDINSDFGLVFLPENTTSGGTRRLCGIDCVRMRIFYSVTGNGNVRMTQAYSEVIADDDSDVRLTQAYAEVIGGIAGNAYPAGRRQFTVST